MHIVIINSIGELDQPDSDLPTSTIERVLYFLASTLAYWGIKKHTCFRIIDENFEQKCKITIRGEEVYNGEKKLQES